jgi:glycosyltransferase involved in cell wall biosynthesis
VALGIGAEDPVVGFVGRLVADKGIHELLDAFARVRRELPTAKLLLVGGELGGEALDAELVRRTDAVGIVKVRATTELTPLYLRMNVLAFPSHREGFPNVPLEAAACEVPVVGARATGVVDAVVDGVTGALVPVGDAEALASAVLRYLRDGALAREHGRAGRKRVATFYSRARVWQAWLDEYRRLLAESSVSTRTR